MLYRMCCPVSRTSWALRGVGRIFTRKQCQVYDLPTDPVRIRLIRVTLANGQTEVLAISLRDEDA